MATTRIVPLTGPEADRDANSAKVLTNELHTTTDQKRLFMENEFMGPAVHHADVVTEAARLLLVNSSRGCWPGDTVLQTNNNIVYKCVSNNGELSTDWVQIGGGIAFPSTNRINGYVLSIDSSDPTGYQWVDAGVTYVPANPYEPRDVWLFGAWEPDIRDLQDWRDIWMDIDN